MALPVPLGQHANHYPLVGWAGVNPSATVPGAGEPGPTAFCLLTTLLLKAGQCDAVEKISFEVRKTRVQFWTLPLLAH